MRTKSEPPSAAWNIYADLGAPDDADSSCLQLGCKTFRRRQRDGFPVEDDEPDCAVTDIMWDTIPSWTDPEGNEVNLTVFLNSKKECLGRAEVIEELIRNGNPAPSRIWTGNESPSRMRTREAEELSKIADRLLNDYLTRYRSEVPENEQKPPIPKEEPGFVTYDEHIAGPNCSANTSAYSGHNLSYEEMKTCTTVQCLGPKTSEFMIALQGWKPLSDDEDFERTTDYCLSGLGDRPGAVEDDTLGYPIRHGVEELHPGEYDGFREGNLPFHPYCFEVYKRVSLFHKGKIGIDSLAEKFHQCELGDGPHHPAVSCGQDQWWNHEIGHEFLVANPLHIPALRDILEGSARAEPDFDVRDCPFKTNLTSPVHEGDAFSGLPEEIRDMILQPLGSKDIANLRLASSSFRQLPNTLWYRLIREEMPWLWEAWCDQHYSFWACTTMRELKTYDEALQARIRSLDDLPVESRAAQKKIIAQERLQSRKTKPAQHLDLQRTDWHWLYRQIKREWKSMKGLQNRERIWYALAHVVEDSAKSKKALDKLHEKARAADRRLRQY